MPEPTPSNYVTLPPVRARSGPGIAELSHDRLRPGRWSGALELELEAVDRWRVGSGTLLAAARNAGGRREELLAEDLVLWRAKVPLMPGSSLKGAVRTLVEALTGGDWPSRDPERELSVTSGLFGMVGQGRASFRGRVGFDDALPAEGTAPRLQIEDLPAPYAPRDHMRTGTRVYGPAGERRGVIPYLVLERGSRYRTRLCFTNLTEGELGLLARATGLCGSFCPRLGGGKFAGLGRTRFHVLGAHLRQGSGRLSERLDAGQARERVARWLSAFPLDAEQQAVLRVFAQQMRPT